MENIKRLFEEFDNFEIEKWIQNPANDLFACDLHGWSMVHYAAKHNYCSLIKLLYEKESCVYSCNDSGDTPLHTAVQHRNVEAVTTLIDCFAPLDPQNNFGNTPLHYAAYLNSMPIVKALLAGGASPFIMNNTELTASDIRDGDIQDEMLKYKVQSNDSRKRTYIAKPKFPEKVAAKDLARILLPFSMQVDELTVQDKIFSTPHIDVFVGTYKSFKIDILKFRNERKSKNVKSQFVGEYQSIKIRNHPNIVTLCGFICKNELNYGFCLSNMGESLYNLIHVHGKSFDSHGKLRVLSGICSAMEYIHERIDPVRRFVLSSRHVFINSKFVPQVNLAYKVYNFQQANIYHQPQWMAPEAICAKRFEYDSSLADVWSFGIIMWEILQKKLPYSDVIEKDQYIPMIIGEKLSQSSISLTPILTDETSNFVRIQKLCVNTLAVRRPRFEELSAVFEKIRAQS